MWRSVEGGGALLFASCAKRLGAMKNRLHLATEAVPERVTRIELALSAWKAEALPLSYTRASVALTS